MHPTAILYEVQQLYNASNRLDALAEQDPLIAEAQITISGNVRNTATLLEVLVATKMGSDSTHQCLIPASPSWSCALGDNERPDVIFADAVAKLLEVRARVLVAKNDAEK